MIIIIDHTVLVVTSILTITKSPPRSQVIVGVTNISNLQIDFKQAITNITMAESTVTTIQIIGQIVMDRVGVGKIAVDFIKNEG